MKLYDKSFLDLDSQTAAYDNAAAVILPLPFEGGISYKAGTAHAPEAILDASHYVELYDEILKIEAYHMGIATVAPPDIFSVSDPQKASEQIADLSKLFIKDKKLIAAVGGDHSVTTGCVQAYLEFFPALSVIQLDAHADLRESYEENRFSHACTMARIRDLTQQTLQIGIRSMAAEEAERVEKEGISLCTMHEYRQGLFDVGEALNQLPDPVYVTVDLDVFDWSVILSTGTPEPGGFTWDEGLFLLYTIFNRKNVIGFDVVELAYQAWDHHSPFAVAKLLYKLLGFKLHKKIVDEEIVLPIHPQGSLFY